MKIYKFLKHTVIQKTTEDDYIIESKDIILNKKQNYVFSGKTKIIDKENNTILMDNFNYQKERNLNP